MSDLIDHAVTGNLSAVRNLINEGADINFQNKFGRTALIISSEKGYLEIVKILVDAGADVNFQNKFGQTSLIRASREGHLEIVKTLIQARANLNLQGEAQYTVEKGWTALIHASRVGHLEIVKILVDAGADLNLKTKGGWTALMHASDQGHKEVVEVLQAAASRKARSSDPSDRNRKSVFDLIDQASRGDLRAVKDLIYTGVDLDLQDKDKWTALMSASLMGRLEIVKTLVDAGADLNLQDKYGKTALIHASLMGYLEIVKILVDAGADLNLQDIDGLTALKRALNQNHKEVVKVLGDAASRKTCDSDPGDRRSSVMLNSLFAVLGYLAKVDGKVTQEEIGFVTNLMNEMQLNAEQRHQAEELFRMGKQAPAIALPVLLSELKNEYKNNSKSLEKSMKILMHLVYLKRVISEQERLAIKEIATQLKISKSVLDDIEASLLSKSKDDKGSTSSNRSQHSKRDHQSARTPENG
ncbi:MAG: ankyrin repeat domain-containing protein, partial [Candidatus Dadabacteria bacterium]|nr:ankyrin repeat domain-containing protein [Candidatus Dadabacteria bacterium]